MANAGCPALRPDSLDDPIPGADMLRANRTSSESSYAVLNERTAHGASKEEECLNERCMAGGHTENDGQALDGPAGSAARHEEVRGVFEPAQGALHSEEFTKWKMLAADDSWKGSSVRPSLKSASETVP
eukprot:s3081_g11.t1